MANMLGGELECAAMRPQDREFVISEVKGRLVDRHRKVASNGGQPLDTLINDTIYHERKRLDDGRDPKERREGMAFWKGLNRRLSRSHEQGQAKLLEECVDRFVREVAGNFNPYVYRFTTRAIPLGLGFMLNAVSPRLLRQRFPQLPDIADAVVIQGEVEHLLKLSEHGTVILAPTHSSNLDSLVIGWSLHHLGLAPFIYGAGLNLFASRFFGFFCFGVF